MHRLLVITVVLALTAGQSTDPPNKRCKCEIGTRESHEEFTALFQIHNQWDAECDHRADELCQEECETSRDVIEAFGGWSVVVPDNNGGDNSTVGQIACRNLGRDEEHGLESRLYTSVCDAEFAEVGHGIHEPLCCSDGYQVECSHQP